MGQPSPQLTEHFGRRGVKPTQARLKKPRRSTLSPTNHMPRIIRTFDDFTQEAAMLPDMLRETSISVTNPLERALFDVADKHGVLDQMLSDQLDDQEYGYDD